jgi:hypothetical protein
MSDILGYPVSRPTLTPQIVEDLSRRCRKLNILNNDGMWKRFQPIRTLINDLNFRISRIQITTEERKLMRKKLQEYIPKEEQTNQLQTTRESDVRRSYKTERVSELTKAKMIKHDEFDKVFSKQD